MGKNNLIESLRSDVKTGELFNNNTSIISYKTGIAPLDYYLGYRVQVYNDDNEIIDEYPSIGIPAGSYCCFIGKPSTGKTTTACQIAANIVRPFPNGCVIHYDLTN